MGLSLRELKEQLIAKQGYTITPNHNHLNDLKVLVDDMMNVRSESPPSSGPGNYSGTTCSGHVNVKDYNLSLGDINALDIKGCSCHTVNDTTAYCRTRTYSCSCNSNVPTCNCNSRTSSECDCKNRTMIGSCSGVSGCLVVCTCDNRISTGCNCQNRTSQYGVPDCICDLRGGQLVECPSNYKCTCNSRTPEPCNCQGRTSSCGSRNTTSCTCNGRCACNSEKRFS